LERLAVTDGGGSLPEEATCSATGGFEPHEVAGTVGAVVVA
jgi:hypothetical protein